MTFDRRRAAAYQRVRFLTYGMRQLRDFTSEAVARARNNLMVRLFGGATFDDLATVENDLNALLDVHDENPLEEEDA